MRIAYGNVNMMKNLIDTILGLHNLNIHPLVQFNS